MLLNFVLNEVSEKKHKHILKKIDNDNVTRLRYLRLKRKIDVERYLENDMSVGERMEFEKLLKKDKKLRGYYNLSKDVDKFISTMAFNKRRIN
jgi:hypothetical protein